MGEGREESEKGCEGTRCPLRAHLLSPGVRGPRDGGVCFAGGSRVEASVSSGSWKTATKTNARPTSKCTRTQLARPPRPAL